MGKLEGRGGGGGGEVGEHCEGAGERLKMAQERRRTWGRVRQGAHKITKFMNDA